MGEKTVKIKLDVETYAKLLKMRREAGFPSIPAFLLDKVGLLGPETEAAEIVRRAEELAQGKAHGEEFTLRELFPSSLWEQFDKRARLRAGREFFAKVSQSRNGIRATRRTASNHQMYAYTPVARRRALGSGS